MALKGHFLLIFFQHRAHPTKFHNKQTVCFTQIRLRRNNFRQTGNTQGLDLTYWPIKEPCARGRRTASDASSMTKVPRPISACEYDRLLTGRGTLNWKTEKVSQARFTNFSTAFSPILMRATATYTPGATWVPEAPSRPSQTTTALSFWTSVSGSCRTSWPLAL